MMSTTSVRVFISLITADHCVAEEELMVAKEVNHGIYCHVCNIVKRFEAVWVHK